MLRLFAALPAFTITRALADGSSGTLGEGVVGAHELRAGGVSLDRIADLSAGRVMGRRTIDGAGAPLQLDGRALRDLADASSSNLFVANKVEAEGLSASTNLQTIVLLGQFSPGDGGGGVFIRRFAEPPHLAKLRTADGQWWESAEDEPTPLAFGARWDASSDDTDAINDWAAYLRASRKAGRMPPGTSYCAGTVYLGGVRIRGAGGPTLAEAFASKTVIKSNGNPMVSMAPGENTDQTFHLTHWEHFTVVSAGGAFQPIELWDRLSYPYRVGIWLGRNHNFMETVAGGETTTTGGSGGLTMRNVSVQDASGWGVYAYKLWGKSLINDCFFRRCGGPAANDLGDDRLGGAMNYAGVSVDFQVTNIHSYNGGYSDANHNGKGCGLRIGAIKTETDALGRLWEPGGNQKFESAFFERHNLAISIEATLSAMLDNISMSGDVVNIGYASNPGNHCKVLFGRWRSFGLSTINITQSPLIDLGVYLNQDPTSTTTINYATGFSWQPPGGGVDSAGIYGAPTVLAPKSDPASGSRSLSEFLPMVLTSHDPGTIWSNQLLRFGLSDNGPLTNWVQTGGGSVNVATPWRLRVRDGASVYQELTGLAPGSICTLQLWFDLPNAVLLEQIEFGAMNASGGDILRRTLGFGANARDLEWRAVNMTVPADGILRVFVRSASTNNAFVRHPVLSLGACAPLGRHFLTLWPTPDGVIQTS
ncbi:MAG: hypothetical protein ACJAW4_001303 [Paracoccaceae bacterium]|jgi:hypothetical protein